MNQRNVNRPRSCAACGSAELAPRFRPGRLAGSTGPAAGGDAAAAGEIVRCSTCKHMQLEPLPETADARRAGAEADNRSLAERPGQRLGARRLRAALERHTGRGSAPRVGTAEILDPDLPDATFDAIVLDDVIERLPDPGAAIDRARELLAPGGALALTVPDAGSVAARLLGRRWWSVTPAHLQHFNRRSIRILLARHDFEVLELVTLSWVRDRMLVIAGRQGERATLELPAPDAVAAGARGG